MNLRISGRNPKHFRKKSKTFQDETQKHFRKKSKNKKGKHRRIQKNNKKKSKNSKCQEEIKKNTEKKFIDKFNFFTNLFLFMKIYYFP